MVSRKFLASRKKKKPIVDHRLSYRLQESFLWNVFTMLSKLDLNKQVELTGTEVVLVVECLCQPQIKPCYYSRHDSLYK